MEWPMPNHLKRKARTLLQLFMLIGVIGLPWCAAKAAEITVLPAIASTQPERLYGTAPLTLIRLTGTIVEGDSVRLRAILTGLRNASLTAPGMPLAAIELSSNG